MGTVNIKEVIKVSAEHIDAGIKKYNGVLDAHLANVIKCAGLNYTPYAFSDGRILLVLPNNIGGFLYKDEGTLYATLNLSTE